jgi:hypothetical protein
MLSLDQLSRSITTLSFIILAFTCAITYFSPASQVVLPFYMLSVNPDLYGLDVEISNSLVPDAVPIIEALAILDLNLAAAVPSIIIYLTTFCASGAFIFLIARDVLRFEKLSLHYLLIAVFLFAQFKFAGYLRLGAVYEAATPSAMAQALRWAFLYLLLAKQPNICVVIIFMMSLLSLKATWPCLALFFLVRSLQGHFSSKDFLRYTICLAPALVTLASSTSGARSEGLALFHEVRSAYRDEDDPTFIPLLGIVAFTAFSFLSMRPVRNGLPGSTLYIALVSAIIFNFFVYLFGSAYFNL